MKDQDLIKIMNFIGKRVRELIPWSANLDSKYKEMEEGTINRKLQLRARRAIVRDLKQRAQVKQVSFWNLDLSSDEYGDKDSFYYINTNNILQKYNVKKIHHKNGEKYTVIERIEDNAASAIYWQIGNCGEVSQLGAFMYDEYPEDGCSPDLPKIDGTIRVDLIAIDDRPNSQYTHTFLIVNRPGHTNIHEPSEFLNAYIHDLHSNQIYKISEVLSDGKKFPPSDELFTYIPKWRILATTYIAANMLHTERWEDRSDDPAKTYKWWKTGKFLNMPAQKPRPKQEILEYPELVYRLIKKWYAADFKVDDPDSCAKRVLKQEIIDFDGRDIELLKQADIAGVPEASLILEDIGNFSNNNVPIKTS